MGQSDEEDFSDSDSDVSVELDTDESSDFEADCQLYAKEPCKYYNSGGCRNGGRCSYLHACKYYLSGNCRYGSKCKLSHTVSGRRQSSGGSIRSLDQSSSNAPKLTDGRYYQWQLNDGSGWKDVDNDHVLEAQYSLPHTKSIKIYNTPYGAVSVDFNKMKVYGKRLKVRRLDDGNTVWMWYCILRRKWIKYGDKGSKGNPGPVNSSDIEKKFQSNPTSSFTFNLGAKTYEIRFREMRQVGKKRRRVVRRPEYRQQQQQQQQAAASAPQAASVLKNLTLGSKPVWQFEGDSGGWHEFKNRRGNECSVTSDDMERKYKQNPQDTMIFNVNGHSYKLDFGAMTQTNLKTHRTRRIRRVLV